MTNLEIEILRKCTIKAVEYLDENPWKPRHNSVTGDLVYNEILYPTKRILWAIGNQIENENLEVTLPKMSMGEDLFQFFEELGFEIRRKKADNYDKMNQDIPNAYYCVGFHFYSENPTTQLPRFIKDKIWENGYDDKFIAIVNDVPIGALLAAKTSYTMNEDDKTISVLEVHCIGKVISNSKNGKKLEVEWEKNFEPFSLKRKGAYRSTISKVHNQDNINAIFYNQSEAKIIKALNKFDFNKLINYYSFLDKITEKFDLKENDKRSVFNINDKELIFTIGQRYAWNVRNLNYDNFNYSNTSLKNLSSNLPIL